MTMTRRRFLGALAAAPVAAAAPEGLRAHAALPAVDMEAVVKAAQLDPARPDTRATPGAGASVRLVEAALRARGLLDAAHVDGHFGSRTVAAYARWQAALGYAGIAASGLPGHASLTALGTTRFTVARPITVGARTTHQSCPVNARTLAMLRAAQLRCGLVLVVEQGSYSPAVDPTSAGTHDGGGALDLDAERLSPRQRVAAVTGLREVGFAAWLRTPAQGRWPLHVHAIAISDTDLAPAARKQVAAYFRGRNGLANDLPDDGPKVAKVTYEEYLRSR